MQQASITSFTVAGGFFIAFTSVMSALVRVSSAASAASSMGIACITRPAENDIHKFTRSLSGVHVMKRRQRTDKVPKPCSAFTKCSSMLLSLLRVDAVYEIKD